MTLAVVLSALGLFAATNIDDLLMLSIFFARGAGQKGAIWKIVLGQYAGFTAILAISVLLALGVELLIRPEWIPLFGLIPIAMGLWFIYVHLRGKDHDPEEDAQGKAISFRAVSVVSFAHGGNNIGLYVPVFANVEISTMLIYCAIFIVLDGLLLYLAYVVARHPLVARTFHRWEHIIYPTVLIGVGALILAGG
ncbi:cadmium resistance transporter [Corynebacterium lubricantis]|uniref:cadmium resistance transporter n=1 Tax=Corynebacterium lubricantis TaxID=541095 RepID=UPI000360F9F3|nr:cadmium resistance transporter [Corynebacterium lubricantis]